MASVAPVVQGQQQSDQLPEGTLNCPMEPHEDGLGAVGAVGGFRPTPSNIVHRSVMFSDKGQTAPQGAGLQLRCRMWEKDLKSSERLNVADGQKCCPLLAVCRAVAVPT